MTPGGGDYPKSKHREKESGYFEPKNSRGTGRSFANGFSCSDSAADRLVPVPHLPQNAAYSLRPLEITNVCHTAILTIGGLTFVTLSS